VVQVRDEIEARKRAAEKGWLGEPQEPVEWQLNAFFKSHFLAELAARREAEGPPR
jgi:hypothetical protein